MKTELTINIDSKIKELAESYAADLKTNLSTLIENYFKILLIEKKRGRKVHPVVESLTGVINLDDKKDFKKAKAKLLKEKYK